MQPGAKCFVNPPAEDQASSNETAVDTGEGNQQERTSRLTYDFLTKCHDLCVITIMIFWQSQCA